MISNEKVLPYDRTLLSKGLAAMDASKLTTRSSEFLDEYGIEFSLGYEAKDIDKKGITAVSDRASKNGSLKWSGAARRASELDAMQFIRADITESELKRRVRAFHRVDYPLFTEICGKRFFYKG